MTSKHFVIRPAIGVMSTIAAMALLPVVTTSAVAGADPGIGWGAPGPGLGTSRTRHFLTDCSGGPRRRP